MSIPNPHTVIDPTGPLCDLCAMIIPASGHRARSFTSPDRVQARAFASINISHVSFVSSHLGNIGFCGLTA
jgi:hypothetical protein